MHEPIPEIDPPESRRCAICGETASYYGFSPPGFPLQPAEAWYCGAHRQEGERGLDGALSAKRRRGRVGQPSHGAPATSRN